MALTALVDGGRVAHRFSFLCCVVLLCFVFSCPVASVANVAGFSGLSILDCPFGIL